MLIIRIFVGIRTFVDQMIYYPYAKSATSKQCRHNGEKSDP